MKSINNISCWIVLALSNITAAGADNNFNRIVSAIFSNNPDVYAARAESEAEKASLATENNLSDPEIEFDHQWGSQGIGNKWSIGISQSFEWPGVYHMRARQTQSSSMAINYLEKAKMSTLRLEITSGLINLIYDRQKLQLYESMLSRIDSLIDIYRRGAELGEISRLDINKLRIERIAANRRVNEAAIALTATTTNLTRLNGGNDCSALIETLDIYPCGDLAPREVYVRYAIINNPEIRYNTALGNAEQLREQTLRRSRFPGFSIGYSHDYEIGDHFNGIRIGLTLPLFSNRKKIAASTERQRMIQAENDAMEIAARAQISADYDCVIRLDREISQYKEVIDDDENKRLLGIALNAGQISLIDYFLQVNYFLEAHSDYIEIQRQRALAMARLRQWESEAL